MKSALRSHGAALTSVLLAATLTLLLSGCSSFGGANNQSDRPVVDCKDVFETVIARVRTDDTAGTINSEIDWLSRNCSAEYDTFTDYASARGIAQQAGPDSCESLTPYIGREAIILLSEDGLCSGETTGSPAGGPVKESQPDGGIAWNEAINFAGTTQRVCGPLAGSGNSGDDVFLNLGRDYPDPQRFQIVLWDVGGVEALPWGTRLCTTGQITMYKGVPQIELESASLVEVYE